jgi:hypothetical protein
MEHFPASRTRPTRHIPLIVKVPLLALEVPIRPSADIPGRLAIRVVWRHEGVIVLAEAVPAVR